MINNNNNNNNKKVFLISMLTHWLYRQPPRQHRRIQLNNNKYNKVTQKFQNTQKRT